MDILQTTRLKKYTLTYNINLHYIQEFKFKFSYLNSISAFNQSRLGRCGAVFLSYLTMPIWVAIGCNHSLPHNYFLCEINGNSSHHQHELNIMVCPNGYAYVNTYCWLITTKQPSFQGIATDPPISLLAGFLTSWSLGHASCSTISLYSTKAQLTCLSSNDFPNQRLKEWVKSVGCNNLHALNHRAPLWYHSICQGMLFIVHAT